MQNRLKREKQYYFILIIALFLILPWAVFLWGYDPVSTAVAPGDGEIYGLQMQLFTKDFKMWNPFLAGGKSQLAEVGSQSLYLPAKLILKLFPNYFGYNLLLLLHYSFAGYFTYRFLKLLGLKEPSAVLSGIAFMFCGFMAAHKGHNTMVCVAAYLPCILYLIEKYFATDRQKDLVMASLIWGFSITADYTACSLYIGMVCFPYIVFKIFSRYSVKELKKIIVCILKICICMFGLGTMLASYYLLPVFESLQYITRETITYDFFAGYSFPVIQIGMILFPSLFGGGVSDIYYFGKWNITEISGYMGLLVLVVAVACILFAWKKNPAVRFWAVIVWISFLLVLGDGTPFYKIMYKIPVYNMFRVPARNWFELNFAVCVLFGYGIDYLMTETALFCRIYAIVRKVYVSVLILEAAILIVVRSVVALSGIFEINETYAEKMNLLDRNTQISSKGIYIYLILLFLVGIDIYFLKKYRKKTVFWILTGCLLVADLFPFAYFHDNIRTETYQSYPVESREKDSITNWIKNENDGFRIWNVSGVNRLGPAMNQNEEIMSVNSYGPVWLKDYAELTGFNAAGKLENINTLIKNNQLLSMLGTKYIIADMENSRIIENSDQPDADLQLMNDMDRWETVNAAVDHNRVTLNAGNYGYSLVQYKLTDADYSYIRYSFSVEAGDLEEGVYVDFYNEADFEITHKYYSPEEIGKTGGVVKDHIILPGSYSDVYLRIFTYSQKNIVLTSLDFEDVYTEKDTYIRRFEDENGNAVYENTNAFERAYFVENVIDQLDVQTQIGIIQNSETDLKKHALTDARLVNTNFGTGEVLNSIYEDHKIILDVKTADEGFLVLTDNFYQGWNVFVDGVVTPMYKVNGIQRGVVIQGNGKHRVEFVFRPLSFYYGTGASLICLAVLLCSLLGSYMPAFIKNRK